MQQTTLASTVECQGIGLHSGTSVSMVLHPAPAHHGIVFRRTDLPGNPTIPALWNRVSPSPLCTTIAGEDGVHVATIEHLMAALAAYALDNVLIDINGAEVPIMDGSAAPFLFLLDCAGVRAQTAKKRVLRVTRPVTYNDASGGKAAALLPFDTGLKVTCHIDFASRAIGRQHRQFTLTPESFRNQIGRARTFGFLAEVEQLRRLGLARGGSLENAIVIDGDTVLNPEGTRYADECVRHKVLDAIGDLALAGASLLAHYHADRPGHFVNYKILETLFANPDAYVEEWVEDNHPAYRPTYEQTFINA
jgi:UDP-3-O-[3-hydroxymyristoyl] N-acetylglucosamine deacetylase